VRELKKPGKIRFELTVQGRTATAVRRETDPRVGV
jgi:hypothetical protein